jgi:hypothetical protein
MVPVYGGFLVPDRYDVSQVCPAVSIYDHFRFGFGLLSSIISRATYQSGSTYGSEHIVRL